MCGEGLRTAAQFFDQATPNWRREHRGTLDELVGETTQARKRGPAPKLQQQLEQISQLPRAKQRCVIEMLDTVLQQTG